MLHPYRKQPDKAFWKKTISPVHPMDIANWYEKRYAIDGLRIATAGSCFAQHIGRNLRTSGFEYMDTEPAPALLPRDLRLDHGYDMYSARYGNVYTSRQLVQLFQRAFGTFCPKEDHWLKGDGIVDPFRPTIEPEPFSSVAEMHALRESHLEAVVEIFEKADVFVFTLGLTEAWLSKADGAAFPLCPGTAGGTYDETRHAFENLSSAKVRADMEEFIALAHKINPKLKLFLTVSPVPLMATASTSQVAVASSYSKAVLRAVAGELYDAHDFVDYFPSYEIISSSFMKGYYFEPDAREVSHHGVNHVMSVFFSQHKIPSRATPAQPPAIAADNPLSQSLSEAEERERVKCDEELLNAFSGTD